MTPLISFLLVLMTISCSKKNEAPKSSNPAQQHQRFIEDHGKKHKKIREIEDIPQTDSHPIPKGDYPGVSKVESLRRSDVLKDISYSLDLDFTQKPHEGFHGKSIIQFTFTPSQKAQELNYAITFDFYQGQIFKTSIEYEDGKTIELSNQEIGYGESFEEKFFFSIPQKYLNPNEKHKLHIDYYHPYDFSPQNQLGMHYITSDKESDHTYIYSQFEVFGFNRLTPSIDQLSPKQSFHAIRVKAPREWQILTATNPIDIKTIGDNKLWSFAPINNISPYQFSLHLGDYVQAGESLEFQSKKSSKEFPIRLFLKREDLKKWSQDNIRKWNQVTLEALHAFEELLQVHYAYHKYDQIIVNEFAHGAMENIGAVTFRSNYFTPDKAFPLNSNNDIHYNSKFDFRWDFIVNVILHEMAHMWFGNLVTPKWWDDLWLNESFASFYPIQIYRFVKNKNNENLIDPPFPLLGEIAKREQTLFLNDAKKGAINSDLTHSGAGDPLALVIDGEIEKSQQISKEFEYLNQLNLLTEIYQKGPAVLDQLAFQVGDKEFDLAVSQYLEKNQGTNVVDQDFREELITAGLSSENLDLWLDKPGVDQLTIAYNCESSRLIDLRAELVSSQGLKEQRRHQVSLALYDSQFQKIGKKIVFTLSTPSLDLSDEVKGLACPRFVIPNSDQRAYVHVNLDRETHFAYESLLDQLYEAKPGLDYCLAYQFEIPLPIRMTHLMQTKGSKTSYCDETLVVPNSN